MENYRKEFKNVFNLFELLTRPIDKEERRKWTKINLSNHKTKDYRDVRKEYLYPQVLRVLLKAKKAEELKEEWKKLTRADLTGGLNELKKIALKTHKLSTQKKVSLYRGFAMPEYLAKTEGERFCMHWGLNDDFKADYRVIYKPSNKKFKNLVYKNNDLWIWKNLGHEIWEAVKSARCRVYALEKYAKKYGEAKVESVLKLLEKISNDLTERDHYKRDFSTGEYKEPVTKKFKYKEAKEKREEERKEHFSDAVLKWRPIGQIVFDEKVAKNGRKYSTMRLRKGARETEEN